MAKRTTLYAAFSNVGVPVIDVWNFSAKKLEALIKARHANGEAVPGEHLQRFAHQNQIGIVGDIAARRSEMNNRPGLGTYVAIGVDVRHYVVSQLLLVARRDRKIDVINLRLELVELLPSDR